MAKLTNVDFKYLGTEPKRFDVPLTLDSVELIKCFNWYNHLHSKTDAKKWCLEFAKKEKSLYKLLSHVHEEHFPMAYGSIAKLYINGVNLDQAVIEKLEKFLQTIISKSSKEEKVEVASSTEVVSIQEKMIAKANAIIGELEEIFDEQHAFIKGNKPVTFSLYTFLTKNQIKKQYCSRITEFYSARLSELLEAKEGSDEQVTEAYSYLSNKQYKKLVEYFTSLIDDSKRYSSNSTTKRVVRKKKEKPIHKVVGAVKYMKQFSELKLVSIDPANIVGAQQLWMYNVKYKKLTRFDALGPVGLSVKGTSIVNFDEKNSVSKSLRKPKETLDKVLSGGKLILRKLMDELKTKEQLVTGRINNDVILLRAIK